jgi:hypothetical protein
MMIDISDIFLQVTNNATTSLAPVVIPAVQQTQAAITDNTNGIIATAIAAAGGLITKHLWDTKKRNEVVGVASDIDKMQMQEIADNYNDFAQVASVMETFMRLVIKAPDAKMADILNIVIDDVTKQTMGMKLVRVFQDIQKYNVEYYRNTAFKPNSVEYNGKNPLKNVRNMVEDMSTPTF